MTECVYLIGSVASPLVKIGRSIDVRARLATLQSMSPVNLAVLWQTIGGAELELALHRHFDIRRRHGEWFDFPDGDAVAQVAARDRSRSAAVVPARSGEEAASFVARAVARPAADRGPGVWTGRRNEPDRAGGVGHQSGNRAQIPRRIVRRWSH